MKLIVDDSTLPPTGATGKILKAKLKVDLILLLHRYGPPVAN